MTELKRRGLMPLVIVSFALIWFVWGSTFLAIHWAIADMPPLIMCGTRLLLAGVILLAWAAITRAPWPRGAEWGNAALVGLLLPAAGNGSVTVGTGHLPSGIVALLLATIPLWMALLASLGPRATPPAPRAVVGLVLGFGGILLLIGPGLLDAAHAEFSPWWTLVPVLGAFSWAWGSLWSRRVTMPGSPLVSTAVGMTAGGLALLVLATVAGEWPRFVWADVGPRAWGSLIYLAVFGSVFAFSAYLFLLQHVRPEKVATYAFINPIVAMVLGWTLAGETMSARTLVAGAIVVLAVALITTAGAPAASITARTGWTPARGAR